EDQSGDARREGSGAGPRLLRHSGMEAGVRRRGRGLLSGRKHDPRAVGGGKAGRGRRFRRRGGRGKVAQDSVVDDGGGWGGVTLAYNVGSPAEVDTVLAEAEAAGGNIGRPGAPTFWGGYSGVFVDPEGDPWGVAHNPGWTLAAGGSF